MVSNTYAYLNKKKSVKKSITKVLRLNYEVLSSLKSKVRKVEEK